MTAEAAVMEPPWMAAGCQNSPLPANEFFHNYEIGSGGHGMQSREILGLGPSPRNEMAEMSSGFRQGCQLGSSSGRVVRTPYLPEYHLSAFDPWLSSLWTALHLLDPIILPRGKGDLDGLDVLDPPKFEVIIHSVNKMIETGKSVSSDLKYFQNQVARARSMSPAQSRYIGSNPQYLLQMITNQKLTKHGTDKDVRHLEFESLSFVSPFSFH
ncbi:hypothetical protein Taro_025091 [Colocasia esculenta]|uniref:Uncharacterized protein n=1 Tax=Colocasia esculenta TaxID=4460 RepID=A0A843V287_COLES|nr:hypothetical protein [Colocasia esculenta]